MGWALGNQDGIYLDEILSKAKHGTKMYVVYYKDDIAVKNRYQKYFSEYCTQMFNVSYYTWETFTELFGD